MGFVPTENLDVASPIGDDPPRKRVAEKRPGPFGEIRGVLDLKRVHDIRPGPPDHGGEQPGPEPWHPEIEGVLDEGRHLRVRNRHAVLPEGGALPRIAQMVDRDIVQVRA